MWDLPEAGLEPVSPALAGGFLVTVPPGKSHHSTIYWKDYSFSMIILASLLKISWLFISGLSILFHWFMSVLLLVSHCLDYCSLEVKLWNWKVWVFQLCSFSWSFLLFWVPWVAIWILGSACRFLQLAFWEEPCSICRSIWGVLPS